MDILYFDKLKENKNFFKTSLKKKRIIFGNYHTSTEKYLKKCTTRYNGKYPKVAHYVIDIYGKVTNLIEHKHHYSKYFNDEKFDNQNIIILLENEGWLDKSSTEFVDCYGNVYKRINVFEKKWKNKQLWSVYTQEQFDASVELADFLLKDTNIERYVSESNTKLDNISDIQGVYYCSNVDKFHNDVTPSWSFEEFKNKLEKK
jgi:hypothetical protein